MAAITIPASALSAVNHVGPPKPAHTAAPTKPSASGTAPPFTAHSIRTRGSSECSRPSRTNVVALSITQEATARMRPGLRQFPSLAGPPGRRQHGPMDDRPQLDLIDFVVGDMPAMVEFYRLFGVDVGESGAEWNTHHREAEAGGFDLNFDSKTFTPVWNEGWT